jgi:Lon protease-like protein
VTAANAAHAALPMFPLGTVLFPYVALPLHVFEPRYRSLMHDCMAGDREFGVVLIERGHEVGGGDARFTTGTVAKVLDAAQTEDGRWAVMTVGSRRIRVVEWLAEDPYPRALVEDVGEPAVEGQAAAEDLPRAERAVRRALALKTELAEPVAAAPTFELAPDPEVASWQLAAYAPLGPVDQLRVLDAVEPSPRLQLLADLVEEEASVLALRLASE